LRIHGSVKKTDTTDRWSWASDTVVTSPIGRSAIVTALRCGLPNDSRPCKENRHLPAERRRHGELLPTAFAQRERVLERDRDGPAAVGVEQRRGRLSSERLDTRNLTIVERRHLRLARQCRLDIGRQLALFFGFAHRVARLELGHHVLGKDLQRLADMLMAICAALLDKHDLVDAGLLVARQMRAQLVGGADAAAAGIVR